MITAVRLLTRVTTVVACALVLLGPPAILRGAHAAARGASGAVELDGYVRVVQSDTLEAMMLNRRVLIGVIGVQAPQANTPCGKEATAFAQALVDDGAMVERRFGLASDGRYRRLYHVRTLDGRSVAEEMVAAGSLARTVRAQTVIDSPSWSGGSSGATRLSLAARRRAVRPGLRRMAARGFPRPPAGKRRTGRGYHVPPGLQPGGRRGRARCSDRHRLLPGWAYRHRPEGRNGPARQGRRPSADSTDRHQCAGQRLRGPWSSRHRGRPRLRVPPVRVPPVRIRERSERLRRLEDESAHASDGQRRHRESRRARSSSWVQRSAALATTIRRDRLHTRHAPSHSVGGLRFATDDTLFVTLGDASSFSTVDPDSLRAQDLDWLSGKVLRVTQTGQGLSTNPYWNGHAERQPVEGMGLRRSERVPL